MAILTEDWRHGSPVTGWWTVWVKEGGPIEPGLLGCHHRHRHQTARLSRTGRACLGCYGRVGPRQYGRGCGHGRPWWLEVTGQVPLLGGIGRCAGAAGAQDRAWDSCQGNLPVKGQSRNSAAPSGLSCSPPRKVTTIALSMPPLCTTYKHGRSPGRVSRTDQLPFSQLRFDVVADVWWLDVVDAALVLGDRLRCPAGSIVCGY